MANGQRVDPFNNFNFLVEIDGITRAAFQEASGFDSMIDVIEHREGGENTTVRKLPGMTKYSNITLKWGTAPTVDVANSSVGTNDVVCLSEKSKSGTTFVIADIAAGPNAGTYFGKGTGACGTMTEAALSALGGSW